MTAPHLPPLPDHLTWLSVVVPVPKTAAEAHKAEMEKAARNAILHAMSPYLETADD